MTLEECRRFVNDDRQRVHGRIGETEADDQTSKRIGVVGLGAISRAIVQAVDDGRLPVELAGVVSRDQTKAAAFLGGLKTSPQLLELPALLDEADIIVEAAGGHVVPSLAEATFAARKDLVVISIGALLDRPDLLDLSREKGCRLILPSGRLPGSMP